MTLVSLLLFPLGMALHGAPAPATPWYERASCDRAIQAVLSADFDASDDRLRALESSSDVEDKACAVWARVVLAEVQIAIGGRMPALLENREHTLKRMYGFSRAHAALGPRFRDLEIEARVRRVRVLVDLGERREALKEMRRAGDLLDRRKGEPTATMRYVRGVSYMAVSQSPWALRTLMGMAGIRGEAEIGRGDLKTLERGTSVYRYDAVYLLHYFAEASPGGANGIPSDYSRRMSELFPTNPQFSYDYALDLQREKRCGDSLRAIERFTSKLQREPMLWSSQVRAKLYWLSGRCAMDLGDRALARTYVERAEAQKFSEINDKIEELRSEL